MSELLERLQKGLGASYRLDRELGGGGMSRVFLAEEIELGRQVVIKVLPPEMGAGVNKERFQREIKLAASLQHPHVVPLLTAGEVGGDLLYYVMPYIEGEALRAKLAREGELPVSETVQILREVVDALAYAHRHDVVHRDIKPDNVLLSEGHALVTDFGVAKAVSASSGGASSLTSLGVALGTPAYMSPEQAAADPHVDHRADIYAVGALAYEMLTGRPPFVAQTAQQVLAAHVSQTPDPVTAHRETIPPGLADVVMRCLAKRAADRWQSADELKAQLAALLTPSSGGVTPVGTQPVPAIASTAVARNHPVRVAATFFGAAALGLIAVYALMIGLGLPDWVFTAAVGLFVVGLPIVFVTGRFERRRAVAATTGLHVTTPVGLEKHFTWNKAILGGGVAFASLAALTGGFMGMRAMGVGPAGTLMTTGVLDEKDRIIIADFENRTSDSSLGQTLTELLRIDLSQSPAVVVLEPTQIGQILQRMQRDPETRLTTQLAQEAAAREGIKAYVSGDVVSVGTGFVVSGRVIATATGEALVSHREQAGTVDEIVEAVDRLSATLRERMGESLRTVRADPPLERVTTSSMEALRLYAQASLIGSATAEYDRGIQLLQQAVELDTTFAMAYRKLAVWSYNATRPEQGDSAIARAFELRSRVGDRERWLIEGTYYGYLGDDDEAEANAYLSLLDKYPNDVVALNNQALNYRNQGRRSEAADLLLRSVRNGGAPGTSYPALIGDLGNLGRLDEAEEIIAKFKADFPDHPTLGAHEVNLAYNRGDVDAAEERARQWRDDVAGNPQFADDPINYLHALALLRGRLDESSRLSRERLRLQIEWLGDRIPAGLRKDLEENVEAVLRIESMGNRMWYGTGPAVTGEEIEGEFRAWATRVPDTLLPRGEFLTLFARAGEADRAQAVLDQMRRMDAASDDPIEPWRWKNREAAVALARGNAAEAARLYQEFRDASPTCDLATCYLFEIGLALDSAGMSDSALTYLEQYLTGPAWSRLIADGEQKPIALRKLGELYEERGDRDRAIEYYNEFVELWENADSALQPAVTEVKERMARLVGEGR